MKICIVGHSHIDLRQERFCDAIRKLGHEVLEVFPSHWHKQSREGGFEVANEGSIQHYHFGYDTYKRVREFEPEIIWNVGEFWQQQTFVSRKWAERLGCKFAFHSWENLRLPSEREIGLIKGADLITCGNQRAKEIVEKHNEKTAILPQTGIDTENLFRPTHVGKDIDVLNLGRQVPEKGIEYIRRAHPGTVFMPSAPDYDYRKLPAIYNRAKIFCSYPYDTPWWVEQAGNYVNIEALACEVPVVTSNSGTIPEWLGECGGAVILPQKDEEALRKTFGEMLSDDERRFGMGEVGREFVRERFSNEIIAEKLIGVLEKV